MTALCLIDTSIFVQILKVPTMSHQFQQITGEMELKIKGGETLFLPMATIIETGNHIGQNGDGNLRRQAAQRFVAQVEMALAGTSPFTPINFLEKQDLETWINEFPDYATRRIGLGDVPIIQDYEKLRKQHPGRSVYIWSRDQHLAGYHAEAKF